MTSVRLWVAVLAWSAWLAGCDECRESSDCDDGRFCNGAEWCGSGVCRSGTTESCNDNLDCTTDRCDEESDQCVNQAVDRDSDGHFAQGCDGDDCDDDSAEVHPGATEVCDGLDDDCDGVVNEDRDGDDAYNDELCDGDDCDDDDGSAFPGAPEPCDGVDNNCVNGVEDESDTDGDGSIDVTCEDGDDCDDEDPLVSPASEERCNGRDDDCDDAPDEDFECVRGDELACVTTCGTTGSVECPSSCDLPPLPESCEPPVEVCNGMDDDCDGLEDEELPCSPGEMTECTTLCDSIGTGFCTAECRPAEPEQCYPPAEQCNGVDDDCDGRADNGFFCAPGESAECTTTCASVGLGPCGDDCAAAPPEECVPPAEVCGDFLDNDCDDDLDCMDEDCLLDPYCGL